jgi:hypothetical protein
VTDRWHHFLITVVLDGDCEIIEETPDGVRSGRLSFYNDQDLKVWRIPDVQVAKAVAAAGSRYGRSGYDYILFADLLAQATDYWWRNGMKPVPYTQFKETEGKQMVCTGLVKRCCLDSRWPLVPPDLAPTPSALQVGFLATGMQPITP